MSTYTFRLAEESDRQAVIDFVNTHWGAKHPLVNLPDYFDYYYQAPENRLRFALAEAGRAIAAIAGYIPANQRKNPDIWLSLWVADKQARGSGLELMAQVPALTNCRTFACNNIRPKTQPFYQFLGYTTGKLHHWYRLADKDHYKIAKIQNKSILPAFGRQTLRKLETELKLDETGFDPPLANPYKDLWYIKRRYFHFPRQEYDVWKAGSGLLVTRTIPALGTCVLRIVDYMGEEKQLPELGRAIEALMQETGAEYADFYCAGLQEEILNQTGFCLRQGDDPNILPNYLTPPLFENTEYYYFTSDPERFTMFKADGDQDRPNILIK